MPLWTRTIKPNWTPNVPESKVRASEPIDMSSGAQHQGWIRTDTKETLVCLETSRDAMVCNLDLETGFNFILEDDSAGECFILLERCSFL